MEKELTISVNFRGGIISPGELLHILERADEAGVTGVRFGLRQQLLIGVTQGHLESVTSALTEVEIPFVTTEEDSPNVVSSYPAEEVFITNTWLSEGVYKDIFDAIDYQPKLKINVSDSNQSFTPLLTGNINWVASSTEVHFWHLFIRFPKTNAIYEWDQLVYTNDIGKMSKYIETLILKYRNQFYDQTEPKGELLFDLIRQDDFNIKKAGKHAALPSFNLPYYEGLNRFNNNRYWLGIYRRDELFPVHFLKDMCQLCLETKIGQICSTPWKSVIVKGIEEKDKPEWNRLLARHQVNMRHAANELNFQVEDNCRDALDLKQFLVKKLNNQDTRTFGVCVGIKTKTKTEVFSSILIRRKSLVTILGKDFFHVYDLLCAKEFNPNERTGFIFARNRMRFQLPGQLRKAILSFHSHQANNLAGPGKLVPGKKESEPEQTVQSVFQCPHCRTVYDSQCGEPENGIQAGTSFENLAADYHCPLCETPKAEFVEIRKEALGLLTI